MFLAVVTSRGVAKITASRELADLVIEHYRQRVASTSRRIPFIATRREVRKLRADAFAAAETAIRDALAATEQDTRLRTIKLDAAHDTADDRPFRSRPAYVPAGPK